MQESPGKRIARRMFYEEFLPRCLPHELLRSGHYLLLLGSEGLELPLTDALGVPRDHLCSVEHDLSIYHEQVEKHWGVSLFYGAIAEYLWHLLHTNQAFLVLNLDIEGAYLNHLDPIMSSVLLFAMRNPRTVIATHSTVGRDRRTLREGLASLATMLWLAPEETLAFVDDYRQRYAAAGFEQPIAMVLRDCFWLRSHLEHVVIASAAVGLTPRKSIRCFLRAETILLQAFRTEEQAPLRFKRFRETVARTVAAPDFQRRSDGLPRSALVLERMQHVVYRAQPPWSQTCRFVQCAPRANPVVLSTWMAKTLEAFQALPLTYIDLAGRRRDIVWQAGSPPTPPDLIVWRGKRFTSQSCIRQLPLVHAAERRDGFSASIRSIQERLRSEALPLPPMNGVPKENAVKAVHGTRRLSPVQNGEPTERDRQRIKALASKGLDTETIASQFPSVSRLRIRAFVAVAHRYGEGKLFMRNGRLTLHGRETIRDLALLGYSIEGIAQKIPASVPMRSIRAAMKTAKR